MVNRIHRGWVRLFSRHISRVETFLDQALSSQMFSTFARQGLHMESMN